MFGAWTVPNATGRTTCAMQCPRAAHEFPLIDSLIDKPEAHGICALRGVRRPVMYEMGYSNNNCIACVKGGMGYFNKIRVDFPDKFQARARPEREVGSSCINGVFLDELDPSAGRMSDEILPECGIFCELALRGTHEEDHSDRERRTSGTKR